VRKVLVFVTLIAALLRAPALCAAPVTWKIDRNHSQVSFSIRHLFSKAQGHFTNFSGTIVHDPAKPSSSWVKAEIEAASINTDHERRDRHLRSQDFFFVEKYPTLVYESYRVTPRGRNRLKIEGNLTMRGVTKPVPLDVTFLGAGDVGGHLRSGFEATAKVNRKDFQIMYNEVLDRGGTLLGDEVEIRLNIEGVSVPIETQAKPDSTASNG